MVGALSFQINSANRYAYKGMSKRDSSLASAVQKLSTGIAVSRAKDDSALITAIEQLTKATRGIEAASKNISDSISLTQTADAGLTSITSDLQDIRELAVRANNDTLSSSDKAAIQSQIESKISNISSIADSTSYNDIQLLDGSKGILTVQSGYEESSTTDINLSGDFSADSSSGIGNLNYGNTGSSDGVALSDIDVTTGNVDDIITGIDNAIENLSEARSSLGAKETNLSSKLDSLSIQNESVLSARSRMMDTDYSSSRLALNLLPISLLG